MKSNKAIISKWFIAVILGLLSIIIGVIGIILTQVELAIFFISIGIIVDAWFVAFVPHSFLFDNEKIEILYVFKKRFICLNGIKNCELQESGIRNYPWGFYYHIITNKPDWREIKIPQTDIVDYWLNKHLKRK